MFDEDGNVDRTQLLTFFLKYLLTGLLVTVFFMGMTHYLFDFGWTRGFERVFYFLPWAVVLVMGISAAFHAGVRDEYIAATGYHTEDEARNNPLNLPFPTDALDEWERNIVFPYILKLILISCFGSLAFYGFIALGNWTDNTMIHPLILFGPWIVTLSFGIANSYMMGVVANRRRLRGRRDADRRHGPRRKVERPSDAMHTASPALQRPVPAKPGPAKRKIGRVAPRKITKKPT